MNRRELERLMSHVGCPIREPSRVVRVPASGRRKPGRRDARNTCSSTGARPERQPPSPAQMQEMYAAFNAWKEKFKDNILDMGGKLKPGGKVVTRVGCDGRALRRGQGDRGRVHDRHRRELRARDRGGEGNARDADARSDANRDPGDGGLLSGGSEPGRRPARRRAGPGRAFLPARIRPAGGHAHAHGRGAASRSRGGRGPDRPHDRAHGMDGRGTARRSRRVALPGGPQPPDRGPAAEGRRLRILERAADDCCRKRRPAGAGVFRRRGARTTCCGCSSSAATTPFPGSPGWCSR